MTDPYQALVESLKEDTEELAKQICHDHEYTTPYVLKYKSFLNTEHETYDIILSPGSPVEIFINYQYITACAMGQRKAGYYQYRLRQALARMYKVHRTLKHMVPLRTALAFKSEAKSYTRIPNPKFLENVILSSKHLEITYTVTILDTITGTSIVQSGLDPVLIKNEAIHRLSQMIFSREELMDMLEDIKEMKSFKPSVKEEIIAIGGQDGEVRERREY